MTHTTEERQQPLLLTIPQVAQRLNISRAMVYTLIGQGKGPPLIRLGRCVRVSVASLHAWVQREEEQQEA